MPTLDAQHLMKLLDHLSSNPDAQFARKSVDFYDGCQLTYMVERLDDPNFGRKNWKERNFVPMYRNLTKKIVDRSGLLYIDGLPDFQLWTKNSLNEQTTTQFNSFLHTSDFEEFAINLDSLIRLLKTVNVLIQYDSTENVFTYDTLHKGNSIIQYDMVTKQPVLLVYSVVETDEYCEYYVWYQDKVQTWAYAPKSLQPPTLVEEVDNPYLIIPLVSFHDTNIPRNGVWNPLQKDLVNFNVELNMFLIDSIWAGAYSLRKTLFTNMPLGEEESFENASTEINPGYHQKLPRLSTPTDTNQSGPDSSIFLDGTGVDSPFVQYLGPEINLQQMFTFYDTLTKSIADDWSVRIRADGYGQVNSGFQLVVEEIPNLELRKQRQRLAERALRRMYTVMNSMLIRTRPTEAMPQDATMYVEFEEPFLPIDKSTEDNVWFNRIKNGVSSKVEYLMETQDLTRDEAEQKLIQLQNDTQLIQPKTASTPPIESPAENIQ